MKNTIDLTFDILLETIDFIESIRPPKYEIWISKYVPEENKDGEKIGGIELSAIFNDHRMSILEESERILLISEKIWIEQEEIIRQTHYPVFRAGKVRIC